MPFSSHFKWTCPSKERWRSSFLLLSFTLLHIFICIRDCQQITFIMLNRFCLLSKKNPPPVLNRQYQSGYNTNQNQIKNACPFYIVFQVLEVLLIKICWIQPPDPLFHVVFISFYISRHHFSEVFRTSFNISFPKKRFLSWSFLF